MSKQMLVILIIKIGSNLTVSTTMFLHSLESKLYEKHKKTHLTCRKKRALFIFNFLNEITIANKSKFALFSRQGSLFILLGFK
jgi:hypothetical protein